jgi:hypothetical protein
LRPLDYLPVRHIRELQMARRETLLQFNNHPVPSIRRIFIRGRQAASSGKAALPEENMQRFA